MSQIDNVIGAIPLRAFLQCKCSTPDCTHRAEWIHGTCHPEASLSAHIVDLGDGLIGLRLVCVICARPVITIKVAEGL